MSCGSQVLRDSMAAGPKGHKNEGRSREPAGMSLIVSNGSVGQSDDQASVAFYVVLTRAAI